MEGKAYADLRSDATEAELESCVLLTNAQGKELLAPGRLAEQADSKKIILRLGHGGQVLLRSHLLPLCCMDCSLALWASTLDCSWTMIRTREADMNVHDD